MANYTSKWAITEELRMFNVKCEKCGARMHEGLDTYVCEECGNEVFMGRVLVEKVKEMLVDLKKSFGNLGLSDLKKRAWNDADPFTATMIAILAFFAAKNIALPLLINIIRSVGWLLGPFGLALAIVVPIIAINHKDRIRKKAEEYKSGGSDEPAVEEPADESADEPAEAPNKPAARKKAAPKRAAQKGPASKKAAKAKPAARKKAKQVTAKKKTPAKKRAPAKKKVAKKRPAQKKAR